MRKQLLYIGNKLSIHGKTLTNIETLGPLLEQQGHAVSYASSKKNRLFRLFDMIVQTFRFSKSDYVLIDTYSTSNFWYAFLISQLCRLLKIKYIPILHGGNLPLRLQKNPRLCQMIFNHAHCNVAPSNYLFEAFKNAGFTNLVNIPNAIQMENYPFKKRTEISPKLLWVRSLAPIYNPEMALEVLQKLQKDFPNAALCMVGPNKDNKLAGLQQMAQRLGIQVTFTGKLPKSDWIQLSEQYDIFINTTHFDNMPVSVIEAMALGLPVVSTNVGGLPFLLKDRKTAWLVNDNDATAMATGIKEIIQNRTFGQQMITNAKHDIQQFDWNEVGAKWNEVLI